MGYRISWLAGEGIGRERLLAALDLSDTGEPDEANEATFSVADLPTGWTVLWANDEEYANEARGAELSRNRFRTIAVHVNETCMHSTAALFENGQRYWRLHHEGDERIDVLEAEGFLPDEAGEIEKIARAQQAEENAGSAKVDYLFDIPLNVAKTVCGYKHDQWRFDWGEPSFTVAVAGRFPTKQPRSGLLGQLFGRT
jgi:hypothetical protein